MTADPMQRAREMPECDGPACRGYDLWLGCRRIRRWENQKIVDEAITNFRRDLADIMERHRGQ